MVKNPWTHLRWKGRYSENDTASWTAEMRAALAYDPEKAKEKDDGLEGNGHSGYGMFRGVLDRS